jgi:hypothetical protein
MAGAVSMEARLPVSSPRSQTSSWVASQMKPPVGRHRAMDERGRLRAIVERCSVSLAELRSLGDPAPNELIRTLELIRADAVERLTELDDAADKT